MKRKNIVIMGAGGRDFHNFNVLFRRDPSSKVIAFTAAQIPFIENRTYPPELSGKLYPKGIPIYPEEKLAELIEKRSVDTVVFSYSDVSHEYVMHKASLATSLGSDFLLLGAEKTMLESKKPVISVCAVRTGCGKSAVTRFIAGVIMKCGKTPVVIRHPMPYGDLRKQKLQRFETAEDMTRAKTTIEEMEEYEHLIEAGITVFAGVDYESILRAAEKEGDVIIWDGGNNDTPFIKPTLEIVVADPLRAGHELLYYQGEQNARRADCVIINKAKDASPVDIKAVRKNIRFLNPKARVILTSSDITVENKDTLKHKKVLVVEDGPTLTHGGMNYGAGLMAARVVKAIPVDPLPYAQGTIKKTLLKYSGLKNLLPAMGYGKLQIKELEKTINRVAADAVLVATPVNLGRFMKLNKPVFRVRYCIRDMQRPGLEAMIKEFVKKRFKSPLTQPSPHKGEREK